MPDNRPIGVFDSGVGGLSVLHALQQHLPDESTIYLGDLARCPYGTRPQWEVQAFALQIAESLFRMDIKLLVVACNTATAAAYEQLVTASPVPVIGVVYPGAKAALRLSHSGRIGVVATEGTVASGSYSRAIHSLSSSAWVMERPASWLVPLIERGLLARSTVSQRLAPLLDEFGEAEVDALILGCTHFPLIRDIFEVEVAPHIAVVDSATTTAVEVGRQLRELDLEASALPQHRFLVTGPAEAFAERAQAMFRSSPPIETVDLSLDVVTELP